MNVDDEDSESWIGLDIQAMPTSPGGVALCGACARNRRCRLGIRRERTEVDMFIAELSCPRDHEGGPNVAHGGWTASAMDEVLGHVPLHNGQLSVTATLTVDFRKPVPVEHELEARAWIDKIEGTKWFISGQLVLLPKGTILADASGLWVARDMSHFERHERWLADQCPISSIQKSGQAE